MTFVDICPYNRKAQTFIIRVNHCVNGMAWQSTTKPYSQASIKGLIIPIKLLLVLMA